MSIPKEADLDLLFSLLGRYILHVGEMEGVDFIEEESSIKLDAIERMALRFAREDAKVPPAAVVPPEPTCGRCGGPNPIDLCGRCL